MELTLILVATVLYVAIIGLGYLSAWRKERRRQQQESAVAHGGPEFDSRFDEHGRPLLRGTISLHRPYVPQRILEPIAESTPAWRKGMAP